MNIFVSTIFASHEPGAVSWLQYAFRILYLPIGIFGVARRARWPPPASRGGPRPATWTGMRETLRAVAAHAGLPHHARDGRPDGAGACRSCACSSSAAASTPHDTAAAPPTALALYSIGLVAYTGVKVLAPAFYALGPPRVPLLASALGGGHQPGRDRCVLHARLGYPRDRARHRARLARERGSCSWARSSAAWAACAAAASAGRWPRWRLAAALMAPVGLARGARARGAASGTRGLRAQAADGLVPVGAGRRRLLARGRRSSACPRRSAAPGRGCAGSARPDRDSWAPTATAHKVLWSPRPSCYRLRGSRPLRGAPEEAR